MKMFTTALASLTAITFLSVGAVAPAAETGGEHSAVEQFIAEKLDAVESLTSAQKEKIRSIMRERLPSMSKLVRQFVADQLALRETTHADKVDESAIRAQAAKLTGIVADLAVQRARVARELRGVLTAEQLKNFRDKPQELHGSIDSFLDEVGKRLAAE